MTLFTEALDRSHDDPDALMQATGDLGNAGRLQEVLAIGLPRFNPRVHGLQAGWNLATAALDLGRLDDADRVIHALLELQEPHLPETLRPLSERLQSLRKELNLAEAQRTLDENAPKFVPVVAGNPVWWRALGEPTWMRRPPAGAQRVTFIQMATRVVRGDQVQTGTTTWDGRLTRGFPLL